MSISSEITRISNNVQNTIDTIGATGVTVPDGANSDDLPSLAQALANTKQDKLTGAEGQVVGFDESGNAVAQEAPSGLPTGGTPGQMLYQGESGPEWGDKPVMVVNVSGGLESGWTADKTFAEVNDAYVSGYSIFMKCLVPYSSDFSFPVLLPLFYIDNSSESAVFSSISINGGFGFSGLLSSSFGCSIQTDNLSGKTVIFTPGTTGLTAKNVQAAIEEVNEKIPSAPKSVTITLPASGWSNNAQTVTVQGVKTSGQSVRISPATKTDADNWVAAGVWCSEPTTANQLVFTCDTAPTENININVELQEVQS